MLPESLKTSFQDGKKTTKSRINEKIVVEGLEIRRPRGCGSNKNERKRKDCCQRA